MGFPKKISQFPINPDLTGQDLLVTVNEFDVTSRINLQQLRDFVIDGKDNTFVTGGTVTEEAELILFRNDGLSFTIDLNPALSNTITGAENIPGGEGLIYSGKTNNELLLRSISGGENVIVETLGNTIQIGVEIPPDTNTFVTGFTYNGNINRFTITDNQNNSYDATINFTQNLNVKRNLNISGTTGDAPEITFETSSSTLSKIESQSFGGAASGNLEFYTYPNAISGLVKRMTIGTHGRVGIGRMGNNDITNTLHVSGSTRITDSLFLENVGPNAEPIIANLVLNSEGKVVSGTTTDNNTFITGTSLNSTIYTINQNDGTSFSTDFDSIVSGKLDTDIFNSYSALTEMLIETKLDTSTFDSYTANTSDIYVSGGTLSGTDLILERTDDDTVNIDLSALSGVTQNSFVTGFTYNNKNNLTISRNDGLGDISTNLSEMSGLTINGDLTVTGDTQIDGRLTVEDQTWFKGSPITFGNSFADSIDFTGRINGNFVPVNDNTSDMGKPTTLSAQKYWRNFYVYNITGGTLNLFNTPTLNNSGNEILVRNTTTGQIDYRDVTTLSGSPTDSFVTGLTYNSTSNTVTLTQNESGPTQSVVIDSFSGITLNGPTSINGNTIVDGDVLITKNVVILGTATTINSSTFSVDDNIITLNANATGSTVPLPIDSGIDILRNSGDTAVLLWEELNGYWAAGLSGATEPLIVNGNNLGGGTSVFKQRNENVLDFNTLSGGTNVTLTSVGNIVRFDVPDNTNTFITGATLNGNTLEIERNDGVDVPVDLTSLISGKLDISSFDSYTANTLDIYVSGGTLSGTDLELNRTDGGVVTIDLSALSGVTQNTFVTGFTYNDNNVLSIKDNENNIYSTIVNEMSGLTINGELNVTDNSYLNFITGHTTYLIGENNTGGGSRTSLTPTLTIFDNPGTGGGSQNYAGPNLRFSDNGNIGDIFYRYNGGGNLLSNAFNFISDGGFNFIAEGDNGSPSLSDGPYFRITKGQSSLLIYDDTTRPRTDVKITNSNGGTAYSRLGVGAQNDYWYIEADDVDTPMHIGYDDNGVDTNVLTFEKSDGLLEGSLEITSGLTADTISISNTPTLDNSGTQMLIRNISTGEIEYRESNTLGSLTGGTNLTTTGIFAQTNGKNLEFKGIQSSGGTVTITSDANTVNLESTSSGGNTVNSATKVFNWFMTIT
tara:strand:- start:5803 stop:9339 length:3537 start_codon:yes stop_codon:yes gene_type:complete